MPKPQTKKTTTPTRGKTFNQKVVARVGKRPIGRNQLAAKMGVKPQAIARALGEATQRGELVKTDKGYQKAL